MQVGLKQSMPSALPNEGEGSKLTTRGGEPTGLSPGVSSQSEHACAILFLMSDNGFLKAEAAGASCALRYGRSCENARLGETALIAATPANISSERRVVCIAKVFLGWLWSIDDARELLCGDGRTARNSSRFCYNCIREIGRPMDEAHSFLMLQQCSASDHCNSSTWCVADLTWTSRQGHGHTYAVSPPRAKKSPGTGAGALLINFAGTNACRRGISPFRSEIGSRDRVEYCVAGRLIE